MNLLFVQLKRVEVGMVLKIAVASLGGFVTLARCWHEEDRRADYEVVSDACWIYQRRDPCQDFRRFGWRKARSFVLAYTHSFCR